MVFEYAMALGKTEEELMQHITPKDIAKYIAYKNIMAKHQNSAANNPSKSSNGKKKRVIRMK